MDIQHIVAQTKIFTDLVTKTNITSLDDKDLEKLLENFGYEYVNVDYYDGVIINAMKGDETFAYADCVCEITYEPPENDIYVTIVAYFGGKDTMVWTDDAYKYKLIDNAIEKEQYLDLEGSNLELQKELELYCTELETHFNTKRSGLFAAKEPHNVTIHSRICKVFR